MNKLDMAIITGKMKLQEKVQNFTSKRDAGVDGIVICVGLCIIGLVCLVTAEEEITTFISEMVDEMSTKASGMLAGN